MTLRSHQLSLNSLADYRCKLASFLSGAIAFFILFSLTARSSPAQEAIDTGDWPAGVQTRAELGSATLDYGFQAIELKTVVGWLEWARVEIPVDVDGQVSGWVWGRRSSNGWFDFGNYRIEGEVRSPNLTIDEYQVAGARLRFGFAEGQWYVGRLDGEVSSLNTDRLLGMTRLTARVPAATNQRLDAWVSVEDVELVNLLEALDIELPLKRGSGELSLRGGAPLNRLTEPDAWEVDANLELRQLAIETLPSGIDVTGQAALREGAWSLIDAFVDFDAERFEVTGNGRIDGAIPFRFGLSNSALRIDEFLRLLQQPDLAELIVGEVAIEADLQGDAQAGIARADAGVISDRLTVASQSLENIDLRADYRPASLSLTLSSLEYSGGSVSGELAWDDVQTIAQGLPNRMQLMVDRVRLDRIAELEMLQSSAVASGRFDFTSRLLDQADAESTTDEPTEDVDQSYLEWQSTGQVSLQGEVSEYLAVDGARLAWNKSREQNELMLNLEGDDRQIGVEANLVLDTWRAPVRSLPNLRQYQLSGVLDGWRSHITVPDGTTRQYPIEADGSFELSGDATSDWLDSGRLDLLRLAVELESQIVALEDMVIQLTPNRFELTRFHMVDGRGRIDGSAVLRRDQMGEHQLNLELRDVLLSDYSQQFLGPDLRTLEAVCELALELSLPAGAFTPDAGLDLERLRGTLQASATAIALRGRSLGNVTIEGDLQQALLATAVAGDALGGRIDVTASVPLRGRLQVLQTQSESRRASFDELPTGDDRSPNEEWTALMERLEGTRIQGTISEIQLTGLVDLIQFDPGRPPLRGSLSSTLDASVIENQLRANAQVQIPHLRLGNLELMREFDGRVQWVDDSLELSRMRGMIAGGRVGATGRAQLGIASDSPMRGEFVFDAQRLQLARLLNTLQPGSGKDVRGAVSYRGRMYIDRNIRLTGTSAISTATIYGISIQELRGPLRITLRPDGGLESISATSLHGKVLDGVFDGQLKLSGRNRLRMKASGQIKRGRLDQLSDSLGFDHIVGRGRFSASTRLNSRDAASINALNGNINLEFNHGNAGSFPILTDLGRYVPLLRLASTNIQGGQLKGTLGSGQLRIQSLLLNSELFWLAANGSASLVGGQLDIDALVSTGGSLDEQLSQAAVQNLTMLALPQVAAVARINDLIRNRTVYFRIAGSTSRPVIQPKPVQTVGRALIQEVQRQLLLPATGGAGSAIFSGN